MHTFKKEISKKLLQKNGPEVLFDANLDPAIKCPLATKFLEKVISESAIFTQTDWEFSLDIMADHTRKTLELHLCMIPADEKYSETACWLRTHIDTL